MLRVNLGSFMVEDKAAGRANKVLELELKAYVSSNALTEMDIGL